MTRLRFTLAAAALGVTLAACGSDGPTAPAARPPDYRATADSTGSPITSTTPPAPPPTDPTTPPPPNDRGGQIIGSGA